MAEEVGIRELRQNLSAVLRRVQGGERIIVTSHNRPVAELAPLDDDPDPLARLIEQGLATPPADPGSIDDIVPIELEPGSITTGEALDRTREERLGRSDT